jgi:hypothetical protein
MRSGLLILRLLAGCGSKGGGGQAANDAYAASGNDLLDNLAIPAGDDPARLQALIDRAMPTAIENAKDAQYRNVRSGAGGSVCGEVAAKPAKGAPVFVPFVINPDALAVVGTGPKIDFSNPDDFLADAYIRWCATPDELKRLAPDLNRAAAQAPSVVPPAADGGDSVTATALPIAPPAAETPPSEPPARPRKPPPPPQIDSFFNSVQHDRD